jgi:hypothetical protein
VRTWFSSQSACPAGWAACPSVRGCQVPATPCFHQPLSDQKMYECVTGATVALECLRGRLRTIRYSRPGWRCSSGTRSGPSVQTYRRCPARCRSCRTSIQCSGAPPGRTAPRCCGHICTAAPSVSAVGVDTIAAPGLNSRGTLPSHRFEHTACTSSAVRPCEPSLHSPSVPQPVY